MAGLTGLALFLLVQLQTLGTTSYYFLKLLVGFELLTVALAAGAVATAFAALVPPCRSRRRGVAFSLLAATAMTQACGLVPLAQAPMLLAHGEVIDGNGDQVRLADTASGVVRAVQAGGPGGFDSEYVALGRSRGYKAILPAAWYHSLTGSFTGATQGRLYHLGTSVANADEAAPVVRDLLLEHPSIIVRVAPAQARELRMLLPPQLAARVVSRGTR